MGEHLATVPSEITFVAGTVLTAAQLNTNLRDAVNFLIAQPAALLRQTTTQSINNNTFTGITMDAEDLDSDGGHSNTVNPSHYTAQTAGWFLHAGQYSPGNNATNRRGALWAVNGSVLNAAEAFLTAGMANMVILAPTRLIFLNVGDYSELWGYQDSGGSLSTNVTAQAQSGSSIFWMRTA